ncbi:MAG: DUF1186 domain-containing protein, partial [Candidatus Hydrogenedentes bacterium]|nr:DUF1186 domain-containing protein [Candidatus Hydrogenedentota bacterium]
MKQIDILSRFATHTGHFPHKEVKEAIRTREEITPALLLILE